MPFLWCPPSSLLAPGGCSTYPTSKPRILIYLIQQPRYNWAGQTSHTQPTPYSSLASQVQHTSLPAKQTQLCHGHQVHTPHTSATPDRLAGMARKWHFTAHQPSTTEDHSFKNGIGSHFTHTRRQTQRVRHPRRPKKYTFQTKEHKSPEKDLNEMETSNLHNS